MNRRTLLKSVAGAFVAGRAARTGGLAAQTPASSPTFSQAEIATLTGIAEVVLPTSLNAAARQRVVTSFANWFAKYRQGADMGHGYGSSTLRQPSGPSPFPRYAAQFAALETSAKEKGGAAFAALPLAARREVVEAFLNQPQPVNRLPAQPTGANLIADFMGSYFSSQDAWNLCYQAEIRRDSCRTLDDSEKPPTPIGGR